MLIFYFNSHAHVERDKKSSVLKGVTINFNSHAHVERDYSGFATGTNYQISTHTLTWSVTIFIIS